MSGRNISLRGATIIALLMAVVSTAHGQTPGDFAGEPDKSMASAHESFVKGDMKKAADQIHKASVFVKKQGNKVAKDAQGTVKKAVNELDGLGKQVQKGTVKSGDQLKRTFAQVDHQLATAWHKTADESKKAGKDSTNALKNAGAGLEGAAKWSGTQLKEGAQVSVDGVKKVGQGVKLGAEDVGKFFTGIGQGIADVGQHLKSSS